MRLLVILLCLVMAGCATPKKKHYPSKTKHSQHAKSKKSAKGKKHVVADDGRVIVNDAWMQQYKWMEHERGDYTISADDDIQPDGRDWKVPRAVIEHRAALVEAGP